MDQATIVGPGFVMLPDALLKAEDVSDRAVRLWCLLYRYAGLRLGAVPSRERLARDLGTTPSSVYRARVELEDAGWLAVVRRVELPNGAVVAVAADAPRGDGGRFEAGAGRRFTSNRYVVFTQPMPDAEAAARAVAEAIPESYVEQPQTSASPDQALTVEGSRSPVNGGVAFTSERGVAFTSERVGEIHSERDLATAGAREAEPEPPPDLPALTPGQRATLSHLRQSSGGFGFVLPPGWGTAWVLSGVSPADVDQAVAAGIHIADPRSRLAHLGRTLERVARDRAAGVDPWPGSSSFTTPPARRPAAPDLQAEQRAMVPRAAIGGDL